MMKYGEFIDGVVSISKKFGEMSIHVEDWIDLATQEQWEGYRRMPLTEELVLAFASDMGTIIWERLSRVCTDALYTRVYNNGHAFLRAIHGLAVESGLEIELRKIDPTLTPTDVAVEKGYVGIGDNGEIIPRI